MSVTKACTKCGVVKALTEYHKERRKADGLTVYCKSCKTAHHRQHYLENKVKVAAQSKKWAYDNRALKSAYNAKRRAAKLQRTVAWGSKELIDDIYDRARALTLATGIPMEVDHIYPLQGELVSGLHVESNLQILPAVVNRSKNNTYEIE
jgi:hypothetical protein